MYGGLNWNPQLRAPLTEPGVNARAGEYLLAVNGKRPASAGQHLQPVREHAGKIVEITLGPNADGSGSRTVQVVPIANESALRNRDWVEGNLKKVDKATGGTRGLRLRAEHRRRGAHRTSSATSIRRSARRR